MDSEVLKNWIRRTERNGYIDCGDDFREDEFDFIVEIAQELFKRLRREEKKVWNLK